MEWGGGVEEKVFFVPPPFKLALTPIVTWQASAYASSPPPLFSPKPRRTYHCFCIQRSEEKFSI